MGLFSSSYKYRAYAATGFLFPEDDRPETLKQSILQKAMAPYGFRGTHAEAILFALNTDMYARSRAMVKYTNRVDGFSLGFPESDQLKVTVGTLDVEDAIERDTGETVTTLDWMVVGGPHEEFLVYKTFKEQYIDLSGWDGTNWDGSSTVYFPWGLPVITALSNGDFASGDTGWTKTNASITGGEAVITGDDITGSIVNSVKGDTVQYQEITLTCKCDRGTALANGQKGTLHLEWYDSGDNFLSEVTDENTTGGAGTWDTLTVQAQAPVNAVYMKCKASADVKGVPQAPVITDSTVAFDDFSWDAATALSNGDFASGSTGWTFNNFSVVSGQAEFTDQDSSTTMTNDTTAAAVENDVITLTAKCDRGTDEANAQLGRIDVIFYDSSMVELQVDSDSNTTSGDGVWDNLSVVATAPANTAWVECRAYAYVVNTSTPQPDAEGTVKFDDFSWSGTGLDAPIWDEDAATIAIPIINPDTGEYYTADNTAIEYYRELYTSDYTWAQLQAMTPDQYAAVVPTGVTREYTIKIPYTDKDSNPQEWEMPVLVDYSGFETGIWIQAKYETAADPNETFYWTYKVGSNVDATLEAAIDQDTAAAQFMPVAIMMQDKVWYDSDVTSDLYKTTNKLLKKLNIRGDEVKEDFLAQESSGEDADDTAEKWDFFIHFAMPIDSTTERGPEYLYHFFDMLRANQAYDFQDYQDYLTVGYAKGWGKAAQPINELAIAEGGVNGYNVKYGWSYVSAVANFTGAYSATQKSGYFTETYEMGDAAYSDGVDSVHGTGTPVGLDGGDRKGYHDYVVYIKQDYDADTDTYTHSKILVMAPSCEYTINTRDNSESKYRFRYAEVELFDRDDTGALTHQLKVPIHIQVLKDLPVIHREAVVAEAASTTIFLVEKIKVKWYQTGFFKWLIIIAAVVLIALSIVCPTFLIAASGALSAALGGGYALTMMIFFTLSFAIGFVISLAGQLIGGTWGMAFTIIAMIAVSTAALSAGPSTSLSGPWGSAINAINTVGPYLQAGQTLYMHYRADELQKEMEDFYKTAAEKYDELEAAYAALGELSTIDPMDIVNMQRYYAEMPEHFLNRSLNSNPGITANELVYSFVDMALDLPKNPNERNIVTNMILNFEQG